MTGSGLFIRHAVPDDAEAIARLMTLAFADDEDAPPFTPAWWHWKYGANPAGYHGLVGLDRDGRLVAHYGGVPMRVNADGAWFTFGQNCDSCSDRVGRNEHCCC